MYAIVEYIPALEDGSTHIYVTEGDLVNIEKWCGNFPNMSLIAATEVFTWVDQTPIPWSQVIREVASDHAWHYHPDTHPCGISEVDPEDMRVYTQTLRDTLMEQLQASIRARNSFSISDPRRSRVNSTIRHRIKLVRQLDNLV